MSRRILAIVTVALSLVPMGAPPGAIAQTDFRRDILPILRARCFECHDTRKETAGLRLDIREGALRGGDSGKPAIVPGSSQQSPLIERVTSTDDDVRMPPEGTPLSQNVVQLLRKWIDGGAAWPGDEDGDGHDRDDLGHWAFQAPQRPQPPGVRNEAWVRNDIDRFVLSRLEAQGLAPSPEADRVTLIRRLSLDLVGLPPSIQEVDAFLLDNRPGAYEALVERFLSSPHYGERWGRIWLDAARYADSDGYEKDKPRQVWFYRDWVIQALNRDLPYDQFVIEQIAGDLLPNATQDQVVATGYLRNSMINEEGGIDPEQFRMEAMYDRMDAIGKGILGLTIQCAQCHDHKYDPLTQQDYYRIFAFLNSCDEANHVVYSPPEQMQRANLFRKIDEIEARLRLEMPDWEDRMAAWEETVRTAQPDWLVVRPHVDEDSTGGQKYLPMEDGSFLAQGYAPTKHTVKMTVRVDLPRITAFRLELKNDPNLPCGGPGRSIKGTGALTEFSVRAAPADRPGDEAEVKISAATADVEMPSTPLEAIFDDKSGKTRLTGPVTYAIDGDGLTAWGFDIGPGRRNQPCTAVFVAENPLENEQGTILTFHLQQNHGGWNSDDNQNCNLGRLRLSVTGAEGLVADPVPMAVREILDIPRPDRTPAQQQALFRYWRTTVPEWSEAKAQIESLWKSHPEGTTQLVLQERSRPRPTHVLKRGNFLNPEEEVEPGVPGFLHPLPEGAPRDRLTFARWLVDPRSPTTARSLVNRAWQAYFGTGIVATSEDLGTRCEPPSHPELLDWLAVEFMERGWSLKELHRLIVSSATYRQASHATPRQLELDPANRLLSRGPRLRVDAELVRDVALAASGLLTRCVGGPSMFPPVPDFMFQPPVSYGPKVWRESQGEERYRRGMYTFRYRSVPYPMLQTFDSPNGDFACVRRVRSNTPLQALVTLNEPIALECAAALALRTLCEAGEDDAARIEYAFRLCVARRPDHQEREELLAYLARQGEHFARHPEEARTLARLAGKRDQGSPVAADREEFAPHLLAAWTALSRVLLNLDETITKE